MELANQTAASGRESAGPAAGVTPGETHVPGEPGFWILILGDLTAFALLFCVFV